MKDNAAALITGAGRGLGRALAMALHRRGYRLVLVARTRAELERTATEVRDAGGDAHVIVADVGDPDEAPRIAALASDVVGDIQLLVHNASALGPLPMPLLADLEPDALQRVFDVNLFGPFRLTRAVVAGMVLGDGGVVVQVSSDAAVEAYPGWGAYAASKAAADHLTRTWAAELAEAGVRFFAVDPGEMDTAMHAQALPDADPSTLADPSEVAARIVAMIDAGVGGGERLVAGAWERSA
ncbi:MAG: SDR family NAD(P)-dependent oxidoreductase [Myxococcota bacterium]